MAEKGRRTETFYFPTVDGKRHQQRCPSNLVRMSELLEAAYQTTCAVRGVPLNDITDGVIRVRCMDIGMRFAADKLGLKFSDDGLKLTPVSRSHHKGSAPSK